MTIRSAGLLAMLAMAMVLSSCATTTAPTESSTNTFDKTTNATLDVSSSTLPGSSNNDSAGVERFTTTHFAAVKMEMATGGGEYLTALAALLEVPPEKEQEFFDLTKEHFNELYGSDDTDPREMLTKLDDLMHQDQHYIN